MLPVNLQKSRPLDCFRVYAVASQASLESVVDSNSFEGLSYLPVGGLVAIVGAQPEEPSEGDLNTERLNSFSDRINALHQALDILPFRFTRAVPLNDLVKLLTDNQSAYSKNLQQFTGCTEVNARWAFEDPSNAVPQTSQDRIAAGMAVARTSGSDYLRARHRLSAIEQENAKELAALAAELGIRLGIHCVDVRTSLRRLRCADQKLISVHGLEILLRRGDAGQYLQALSDAHFRQQLPTIASGPWPPYSFVVEANPAIIRTPFSAAATAEPLQKCAIFSGAEAAS
ncbi:MAG: GvpL/GvpF family gas vesicle protein [Pirellulaceae bacterium]|nr:GvpL/GvpF family gas vesicle protein [Pirellulaceae bacterium]